MSKPFRTAPMKDGIRYNAKGEPMTEPVGQSPEERDWKWGDDPAILAVATVRPPGDEAGLRAALAATELAALTLPLIDNAILAIEAADNMAAAADGPVGRTTDGLSVQDMRDIYGALKGARAALAAEPDQEEAGQCPERCLGRLGHPGPHQTSDYEPLNAERLRKAMVAYDQFVSLGMPGPNRRKEAEAIAAEYARLANPDTGS